jgi:energy-coupling factor transporter transmembrane protein EcfT
MNRPVFPPSPFSLQGAEVTVHPVVLITGFAALSLAIGFAWTPDRLPPVAAGVAIWLLLPRPAWRPLLVSLRFLPLLLLVPLLHCVIWQGWQGGSPLGWDSSRWTTGLMASVKIAMWILVSARALDRLHPADLLARLPRHPRLARVMLVPMLAVSFLGLMTREAFLLERSWQARGGAGRKGRWYLGAHWPSLILPLFRNLMARGDTLAEALELRSFPNRWAGRPAPRVRVGDLIPTLLTLLLLIYMMRWGG